MPLKRLPDDEKSPPMKRYKPCLSPEHNPPGAIVYQPGRYEYTCPLCGFVQYFTIIKPQWVAAR